MSEILAIVHSGELIDKTLNRDFYVWWYFLQNDVSKTDRFYYTVNNKMEEKIGHRSNCLVIDDSDKHLYPEYFI
jgi:hypothetical protein